MKKALLFTIAIVLGSLATIAQSSKQVNWTTTARKIAEKTYEVHFTATVGQDYHIYSQNVGADGPIATAFTFVKSPLLTPEAKVKEVGKLVNKYESAWGHEVHYYEKQVDFVVVVKLRGNAKANFGGKVEYMVCNDHECLPPATTDLSVAIGG